MRFREAAGRRDSLSSLVLRRKGQDTRHASYLPQPGGVLVSRFPTKTPQEQEE